MSGIPLLISNAYAFGVGASDTDLFPIGVRLSEDNDTFSIQDLLDLESFSDGERGPYPRSTRLDVLPGFFYLGDREFYAFNEKVTQVSHPCQSGDLYVIPLLGIPDGPLKREYAQLFSQDPKILERIEKGSSPVFVRRCPSGEVTGLGVPLDTFISSREGINGNLGYRMGLNLSGIPYVISGEVDNYPWHFSPLSPYAKGYESWRESSVLPYDLYEYDMIHNAIILDSSVVSSIDEYVIEYEGQNAPYSLSLDLSPVRRIPEDGILCMCPETPLYSAVPSGVEIILPKRVLDDEVISVAVCIRDEQRNRLAGVPVTIALERRNLSLGSGEIIFSGLVLSGDVVISGVVLDEIWHDLPFPPVTSSVFVRDATHVYDVLNVPSGILRYGDAVVADEYRFEQDLVMLPSIGYLSHGYESGEVYNQFITPYASGFLPLENSYFASGETDDNGLFRITYVVPPVFGPGGDVDIVVSVADAVHRETITLSNRLQDPYYSSPNNQYDEVVGLSGLMQYIPTNNLIPLDWTKPESWTLVSGTPNASLVWDSDERALRFTGSGTWLLGEGSIDAPSDDGLIDIEADDYWYLRSIVKREAGNSYFSFGTVSYPSSKTYQPDIQHPPGVETTGVSFVLPPHGWKEYINDAIGGAARVGRGADTEDGTVFHDDPETLYMRPVLILGSPDWENSVILVRELEIVRYSERFAVALPDDCMCPTSLRVLPAATVLADMNDRQLHGGSAFNDLSFDHPSEITMMSGDLYAIFDGYTSDQILIGKYVSTRSIACLDGRSNYGRFGL